MFRPYSVEIVTWDETTIDDLHRVLCASPEHANVFIWKADDTNSVSGITWTLHGSILDSAQNHDFLEVIRRSIPVINKFERRIR